MADVVAWMRGLDPRSRADMGDKLASMVAVASPLGGSVVSELVEELSGWLKTSNTRIVTNGLAALKILVERKGDSFRVHVLEAMPALRDLLVDSHDNVRDLLLEIFALLMAADKPASVFEHLWSFCRFGVAGVPLSKYVPAICKVVLDSNEHAREAAVAALVEAYRHAGERLRTQLLQQDVPAVKLQPILDRFDALQGAGHLLETAFQAPAMAGGTGTAAGGKKMARRSSLGEARAISSALAAETAAAGGAHAAPAAGLSHAASGTSLVRHNSFSGGAVGQAASAGSRREAGGVDAAEFEAAMYEGASVAIGSERDLDQELDAIAKVVGDDRADWEKRVAMIKRLRGIVSGNAFEFDAFVSSVLRVSPALVAGISDLRSQVSREMCVTVSQLADALRERFEPLLIVVVPVLMRQVIINVKVLADSAHLCICQIVKSSFSPKLVTLRQKTLANFTAVFVRRLIEAKQDKAVALRRRVGEYVCLGLNTWDTQQCSRMRTTFAKYLSVALNDADNECRKFSRRAYWLFAPRFPELAAALAKELDPFKLKMLQDAQFETDDIAGAAGASASRPPKTPTAAAPTAGPSAHRRVSSAGLPLAVTAAGSGQLPLHTPGRPRSRLSSVTVAAPHDPLANLVGAFAGADDFHMTYPQSARQGKTPRQTPSVLASSSRRPSQSAVTTIGSSSPPPPPPPPLFAVGAPVSARTGVVTMMSTGARPPSGPLSSTVAPGAVPTRGPPPPVIATSGSSRGARPASATLAASAPSSQPSSPPAIRRASATTTGATNQALAAAAALLQQQQQQQHLTGGVPTFPISDQVTEILTLSASPDWQQRKLAIVNTRILINSDNRPVSRDVRKLADYFVRQFPEPNKLVCAEVIDGLAEFVMRFSEEVPPSWINDALAGLLLKKGADQNAATATKIQTALDMMRDHFGVEVQFIALAKMLGDTKIILNHKVKVAHFEYLATLVQRCTGLDLDTINTGSAADFRVLVSKIAEFSLDPKSAELRRLSTLLIIELFELNPALLARSLAALAPALAAAARNVLDLHVPGRPAVASAPPQPVAVASSGAAYNPTSYAGRAPGYERRQSTSTVSVPPSSALDVTLSGAYVPALAPGKGSRIPAPAFSRRFSLDGVSSSRPQSPIATATDEPQPVTADHSHSDTGGVVGDGADVEAATAWTRETMQLYIRMSNENQPVFWDDEFPGVLGAVLNLFRTSDNFKRISALSVLRELLCNQSRYFEAPDVRGILSELFDYHSEQDKDILSSVEATLVAVATHINPLVTMEIATQALSCDSGPSLLMCLKFLAKIVKVLDQHQLALFLDSLAPSLVKGFKSPSAEVRKAVVYVLVELQLVMGHRLDPYLTSLSASQMKLLGIFVTRSKDSKAS